MNPHVHTHGDKCVVQMQVLECMCVRNKTNSKPDMCTLLRQEAWFHSLMLCLCYFSYDLLMYITTTNAAAPEGYSTTPRTRIMCTCTRLTIRVNNYERSLIKSLILRVAVQTWIFGWWVSWLGDLVWPPTFFVAVKLTFSFSAVIAASIWNAFLFLFIYFRFLRIMFYVFFICFSYSYIVLCEEML